MFRMKSCIILSLILMFVTPSEEKSGLDLITYLTAGSSKYARPVFDHHSAINLTFGFELVHIIKVSESEQSVEVKLWVRMNWKNELLTWDPKEYANITDTRLDFENVWTPDIFSNNDIDPETISSGPEAFKTQVICQSNGDHSWLVPTLLKASCSFDVTNFPYDRQKCHLKFFSWTYDQAALNMLVDSRPITTTENYIVSPEWQLTNATVNRYSNKYNCCPNPFVELVFTIIMDRRANYYVFNSVIPCIIQMLIILFTFFLPPDCGERIGVVITVLLVFAVYLEMISESLPKSSGSIPALALFYFVSMATSSCSLIATSVVLVIHFKGTEKGVQPMPGWISQIFIDKIGWYIGIRKNLREHGNEELLALEKDKHKTNDDKKNNNNRSGNVATIVEEVRVITQLIEDQNLQDEVEEEWQTLGKVFDRIFLIIFLIIFLVSSLSILLPVFLKARENKRTMF